jgi:hypothetical protein
LKAKQSVFLGRDRLSSVATRVVAPTGSLRQQFVLSRVAGAVEADHAVLLVNLNPLREVYASAVHAMGGIVQTPSGPFRGRRNVGNSCLRYLTLADERSTAIVDPVLALENLVKLAPEYATIGALLIVDGCQALAARGRPALRALTKAAHDRSCAFVAIGSSASDTDCIADLSSAPFEVQSNYELLPADVDPDWVLASRSCAPPAAA